MHYFVFIQVIASPLAVVIEGGTQRLISQSVKVRLDASSSFDPDLRADQQTQLTYRWRCESKPRNTTTEVAISTANVRLNAKIMVVGRGQGWIHSFFLEFLNSNSNSLTLKKLNSNSLTLKKLNSNSNSLTLPKSNSNSSIIRERIQIQSNPTFHTKDSKRILQFAPSKSQSRSRRCVLAHHRCVINNNSSRLNPKLDTVPLIEQTK